MKKANEDNNIIKDSLIELNDIQKMIKESSTNQMKDILSGVIKSELKNIITEANDFEEEDVEFGEEGLDDIDTEEVDDSENEDETDVDAEIDSELDSDDTEIDVDADDTEMDSLGDEEEGEEDLDFDEYKTDTGEYDLTNSSVEDVIKVFKKVDDQDDIVVTKLQDDKIEIQDEENDTEYIIDLGGEDSFDEDLDESIMENIDEDPEIEIELGDEEGTGLVDEKNMTQSYGTNRRAGRMTQTRIANAPGKLKRDGAKLVTSESKVKSEYENKIKLIEARYSKNLKAINEELSQYKQALSLFRDKLKENAVLNNNLAKYVKLVTENATTKDEKISILKRFSNEANSIEKGNSLFESIKVELNKKSSSISDINIDKQYSLNENTVGEAKAKEKVIYESKDLKDTINLMNRINRL